MKNICDLLFSFKELLDLVMSNLQVEKSLMHTILDNYYSSVACIGSCNMAHAQVVSIIHGGPGSHLQCPSRILVHCGWRRSNDDFSHLNHLTVEVDRRFYRVNDSLTCQSGGW